MHPTSKTPEPRQGADLPDRFWSLQLWGGGALKVRKVSQDDPLSGIGWLSLAEYGTRVQALAGRKYALELIDAGASEDAVMVAFGQ